MIFNDFHSFWSRKHVREPSGYAGPLCSDCAAGYRASGRRCKMCKDDLPSYWIYIFRVSRANTEHRQFLVASVRICLFLRKEELLRFSISRGSALPLPTDSGSIMLLCTKKNIGNDLLLDQTALNLGVNSGVMSWMDDGMRLFVARIMLHGFWERWKRKICKWPSGSSGASEGGGCIRTCVHGRPQKLSCGAHGRRTKLAQGVEFAPGQQYDQDLAATTWLARS